jgi:hypothetical protein
MWRPLRVGFVAAAYLSACSAMAVALNEDESPPPIIFNPDITITATTTPLCPYQRKLDGQWQFSRVASDGKVYSASSTHSPDTGGMFLQYDPATGLTHVLAQDMSYVCGEDPTVVRPQGKLHCDLLEYNGWLYFATYYGYTGGTYTGGHVLRYRLGSYEADAVEIQDFGIPLAGGTIYSAITVDPVYGKVYVISDDILYRYNIDGSGKTNLGSVGGNCFYHFTDSQGNLWTTSSGNIGRLYMIDPSGAMQYWDNALPIVRRPDNDAVHYDQTGRWFLWGDKRDADHFIFTMRQDGNLYEFDASIARTGDIAGAFRNIAHIGIGGLDMCLAGDTIYWLQSARPWEAWGYTHDAKASDHHLKSINIADPNPVIVDWGRLIDQAGRTPYRCEGMSADRQGHVYLTGDWRVLPNEIGTEVSTLRHVSGTTYMDLWRGQFFAVVDLPVTLYTLDVGATPISSVPISGNPAGVTPYSAAFVPGSPVDPTAPMVAHDGTVSYVFSHWTLNQTDQPEGQRVLAFELNQDSTAAAVYTASPLNITYPDGGGITIQRGKKCTIRWTSTLPLTKKTQLKVELVNDAGESWLLNGKAKNNGVFKWSTKKWKGGTQEVYPDGSNYRIRISRPTGETLDESKETFEIVTPAP